MKTLKDLMEVIIAAEDGKSIQFCRHGTNAWEDLENPRDITEYNLFKYYYRIKQEPMTFWVNVYEDHGISVHETNQNAKSQSFAETFKTIKVREVTDEE